MFHTVICDILGIRYPILQGAMQGGGGVELVAAVCNAGGLGVLPTYGARGPQFPDGAVRPLVRTYTPRSFDPTSGELAIDFVLHGHGSAAAWAERARPGDRAGVSGPGSGYVPDPDAPWFVIAGDESALPAMATIVEALPSGRMAHVVAEVPGPLDRIDLVSPARVITTWLERDGQPPGMLLEAELRFKPGGRQRRIGF